jgi:ribose 5-phosphate isomerase A
MPDATDNEKRLAAEAAAELVQDGMRVGLGTGSTAKHLVIALAARKLKKIRCVATSPATAALATELGISVEEFFGVGALAQLDITIDGADQVDPAGWLVKGGGGAHTREKAVAAAAERFVVIVSANKMVERLTPPVPLELAEFGLAAALARLPSVRLRDIPRSPDGGVIADDFAEFDDVPGLAERYSLTTGIVEHGLFPAAMVSDVLIGDGDSVRRFTPPAA